MDGVAFELASRVADTEAELQPHEATEFGWREFDGRWRDYSPDGEAARHQALVALNKDLSALPDSDDEWQQLAARSTDTYLWRELWRYDGEEGERDINAIWSPPQILRQTLDIMTRTDLQGWEDTITRLATIHEPLEGYVKTLEVGRAKGLVASVRQAEAMAREARTVSGDGSPMEDFAAELVASGLGDEDLSNRLDAAIEVSKAAFGSLLEYLEGTYLADAEPRDGVGAERYDGSAAYFLAGAVDVTETFEWGWSQIAELRAEMDKVGAEILPGASVAEVIELLQTDPTRGVSSRDEFVELMLERQHVALAELDGPHFDVPEQIRDVHVKLSPPGGSLGAHYVSPSGDFARPGSIWYSLDPDQTFFPLFDEVSTAYHEGFPGHHLQSGIQVVLADRLSKLHRTFIWYSGYGEGWALYCERLMHELGYLEKPDYVFGMLSGEMLRACRVVIDIGLHTGRQIPADQPFHPGEQWTYETAVEMLESYATQKRAYAESEVTRYLGWAGQAISYKVGQRRILDLREQMKRRDGSDFDLKQFHAKVLNSGPVGLDHLSELVMG